MRSPSSARPSRGTVTAANGHLVGFGPSPGGAGTTSRFEYDRRDRLVGCAASGSPGVAHRYDASSRLVESTLESGDSQRLYSGSASVVTNQHQPSSGVTASYLGPVRLLFAAP